MFRLHPNSLKFWFQSKNRSLSALFRKLFNYLQSLIKSYHISLIVTLWKCIRGKCCAFFFSVFFSKWKSIIHVCTYYSQIHEWIISTSFFKGKGQGYHVVIVDMIKRTYNKTMQQYPFLHVTMTGETIRCLVYIWRIHLHLKWLPLLVYLVLIDTTLTSCIVLPRLTGVWVLQNSHGLGEELPQWFITRVWGAVKGLRITCGKSLLWGTSSSVRTVVWSQLAWKIVIS